MVASYSWDSSVDARIKVIVEKLGTTSNDEFRKVQLPGLKDLLQDYISAKTDDSGIDFHRRLLQVFKRSADNTYEQLLGKHTQDEQDRLERFVKGAKLEDVGKGFVMGPSLGCREELQQLQPSRALHVPTAGPVHVEGLSGGESGHEDNAFLKIVHATANLFYSNHDDAQDKVMACTRTHCSNSDNANQS